MAWFNSAVRSCTRASSSPSAYLQSAAHQPIHWYPWGREAFAAAEAGDKPVLLDVGAVWCHWCHVMDGESYEDPAIAEFLNQHFVCIKVDRDERPDVDARYQRAVQTITQQGGWPLTAFLTPKGEVFFGGNGRRAPPLDHHRGQHQVRPDLLGVGQTTSPSQSARRVTSAGSMVWPMGDSW